MKRIVSTLLVLAALAALVIVTTTWKHTVRAVYAQSSGCTNATLNSNYATLYAGFAGNGKVSKGSEVPLDVLGVLAFDGVGNVSVSYTSVFNGASAFGQTGTGTYTVNSDCTGSISFTAGNASGLNFNTVIIGGGTEVFGLDTTPGATATFDAKKQ